MLPFVLMKTTIRTETPKDASEIHQLIKMAFEHAPHTDHNEQFIVDGLRQSQALTFSIVVELDNQIVGHVAVSPVQISDGSQHWFGLGPISVLPKYQNQGTGAKLMVAAIDHLKAANAHGCVLLGEPNYYNRFGFIANSRLSLGGVPPEYFLSIALTDEIPQGEVTYHPAFYPKN